VRRNKIVTLEQIILIALVGTLALSAAMIQEDWRIEIRLALAGFALFVFAVTITALIVWIQWAWGEAFEGSEKIRMINALAKLNDNQLAALGQYQQVVQIAQGDADVIPIPYWPLMGGGKTTKAFIQRLIEAGDANYLPSIRDLDDGDRDEARQVYADFIQRAWVKPAVGNQPTKWLNRAEAINQIFGGER
jgi:hypothetical protein